MITLVRELIADEEGGPMAEYALIALLLAIPCIGVLTAIANGCGTSLNTTGGGLTSIAVTNP